MSRFKKKLINDEFVHTWEEYDMIEAQYLLEDSFLDSREREVVSYIQSLPTFERVVFILYAEYKSLRKVADETTVKKDLIRETIAKIRADIILKFYIDY